MPVVNNIKKLIIASILGILDHLKQALQKLGVNANCSVLHNDKNFKYELNAANYRNIFSNNFLEPKQLKLSHIGECLKEKYRIDSNEIKTIVPLFKTCPLSIRELQKMIEIGMKFKDNLFRKAFLLISFFFFLFCIFL